MARGYNIENDIQTLKEKKKKQIKKRTRQFYNDIGKVVRISVVDDCAFDNPLCPEEKWSVSIVNTDDETAASDVEEECDNISTRGKKLQGVQITNAPTFKRPTDQFPYKIEFDSEDAKHDCVKFEVRTQVGVKQTVTSVNDEEMRRHIVAV